MKSNTMLSRQMSPSGCGSQRNWISPAVSAGWSVFAMRDGAAYNTYRVYPHSRLVTPLFSVLLGLLPAK